MRHAAERSLRSIAFPAISTGIYGFPLRPATETAVKAVGEALQGGTTVEKVVFACFSPEILTEYRRAGVTD